MNIIVNEKLRVFLVHRVAYLINYGTFDFSLLVCHKCDLPTCINPDHLFLGTKKDNTQDMVSKGRGYDRNGENNPRAKLNKKQVLEIKRLRSLGHSTRSLAYDFKVSRSSIQFICKNCTWKDV